LDLTLELEETFLRQYQTLLANPWSTDFLMKWWYIHVWRLILKLKITVAWNYYLLITVKHVH
jgi:hypothetical protein